MLVLVICFCMYGIASGLYYYGWFNLIDNRLTIKVAITSAIYLLLSLALFASGTYIICR